MLLLSSLEVTKTEREGAQRRQQEAEETSNELKEWANETLRPNKLSEETG